MSVHLDKWTTIQRGDDELEINVEFDATPLVSATYWQPAEGGEIEITAVFHNGVALDPPLTDDEADKVITYLEEGLNDGDFDDGPDPDDWRDARIDDRLTGGDA